MADEETEKDAAVGSWSAWLADHGLDKDGVMELRIWPAALIDLPSHSVNRTGFWMEVETSLRDQGKSVLLYKGKTETAKERRWIEIKSWPPKPS